MDTTMDIDQVLADHTLHVVHTVFMAGVYNSCLHSSRIYPATHTRHKSASVTMGLSSHLQLVATFFEAVTLVVTFAEAVTAISIEHQVFLKPSLLALQLPFSNPQSSLASTDSLALRWAEQL